MSLKRVDTGLQLALTAILLAYFLPWVPLAPAGLRLVGFEVGEWVKFLPQVQGGLTPDRNLFYVPPLSLALLLALFTARWPQRRRQTWAVRAIAAAIPLLALPALPIVRFEPPSEWALRVGLIGATVVAVLLVGLLRYAPRRIDGALYVLLGMVGALLPSYAFWGTREAIAFWVNRPVLPGSGVVLNLLGHLLIAILGIFLLRQSGRDAEPAKQ